MPYCVFDTETSGLFNFKKPAHDPCQPHLASLAMIFVSDDLEVILGRQSFLVRPDGWEMEPDATEKNGLTTEFLLENGIPLSDVLDAYVAAIEEGNHFGAFNAQFDTKVMRGELRRSGRDDLFEQTPNVCAMRAAAKVIPGKGRFVSLEDACAHFGIVNENPHEAMSDTEACLEVMRSLYRMGALPAASVHYARKQPA